MDTNNPMVQKVIETAKDNLKQHDMLLPTFFVGNDEHMAVVGAPFDENVSSKDIAAAAVRRIAKEAEATFVLFVCESYTLPTQEDAKDFMANRDKYPEVKAHPNAVEVVLFQLETDTTVHMGMGRILDGREMGPVEWKSFPKENFDGRFANFLGTPKRTLH